MPKLLRRICASAGSMLLFIGIIGCGGGPSTVSGKVTYKGAPVTGGTITLNFDGKPQAPGSIDSNGNYAIQTTTTGKATLTIETESLKSRGPTMPAMLPEMKDKGVAPMPKGGGGPEYMKIPSKYADVKTSGLSMEVKSGSNPKNWELVD